MTDYVTCTVCGEEVGRMGIGKHAGVHKREFKEAFGYVPGDYSEVREALGGDPPGGETTLDDFLEVMNNE